MAHEGEVGIERCWDLYTHNIYKKGVYPKFEAYVCKKELNLPEVECR